MKRIKFTENSRYYVFESGRIINYKFKNEILVKKTLKPNNIGGGYMQVTLSDNGYRKSFLVHRIVAETYIPNPFGYKQVNHKDGNPSNNNKTNLEWVTGSENILHSYKNGRTAIRNSTKKKLDKIQCNVIKSLKNDISIKQIATYFNANRTTIRRAIYAKSA